MTTARRAFSLIEMVVSLAVMAVLLLACGSAVRMALQATGDGAGRVAVQLQVADAAASVADDLNVATTFTARTATSATFTVPDRLGTGSPQTVTYAWSGITGDPLLRTFNGGAAAAVLTGVTRLNFDYATRTVGPLPVTPPTEQTLYDYSTLSGASDYAITDKNWASQQFTPSFPLGTSTYSITRVRLRLRAVSQDSILAVYLCLPAVDKKPSGTVLAQSAVYVSGLSTQYEWIDIPITGMNNLSVFQGVGVVVRQVGGSNNAASMQYRQSLTTLLSGTNWSTTSNAGVAWTTPSATSAALMQVFATTQ